MFIQSKRALFAALALVFLIAFIVGCTPTTDGDPSDVGDVNTTITPSPNPPAQETSQQQTMFAPGTYKASGTGRNGPIMLEMDFSEDKIDDIRVTYHNETWHVGNIPVEQYARQVLEYQTLAVDIVSGATVSSVGMIEALRNGVTLAGGDPNQFNQPIMQSVEAPVNTDADVVVIGSGAAGMTAAIHAAYTGKNVILLEKMDILGGTSTFSMEAVNSSESQTAKSMRTTVTREDQYESLVNNNPNGKPEAYRVLVDNNGPAADWLRSIGAVLSAGGPTSVTTSREMGRMGVTIVGGLKDELERSGVDARLGHKAIDLVVENDAVVGVQVETKQGNYTISAPAVIIASGGFAANNAMVTEYFPGLKDYPFSSSPGATGDGHIMAQTVGAELRDMDYIRISPTYHREGAVVHYVAAPFSAGGILVNNDGVRFTSEEGGYGIGMKVFEEGGEGWMIFDQSRIDTVQDIRELGTLGLFEQADSIEELADKIGVNKTALANTVERFQGFVSNGKDEDFGRYNLSLRFDNPPYYACKVMVHVQGTMGGISTDVDTHVLRADGSIISGLYAAGECASVGTYGTSPISVDLTFGKIAGENAAAQR